MDFDSDSLADLYGHRFEGEAANRDDIWRVLCSDYFQKWVPPESTVLDLAAGHCEFVNNIRAARRIAVDLNPQVVERAAEGVEAHVLRSDELTAFESGTIDRVFVSNFFEHIPRSVILDTLAEVHRVLAPTGLLMILQPNIRFAARDYWQFFDHITPVDDRALAEALHQTGFAVVHSVPRFLPYTTKGRLPSGPGLVRWYLRLPFLWRVFGAQTFMVARPRG